MPFQGTPGLQDPLLTQDNAAAVPDRIGNFVPPPAGGAQRLTPVESYVQREQGGHLTTKEEEERLAREEEARQLANLQRVIQETPAYRDQHPENELHKLSRKAAARGGLLLEKEQRELALLSRMAQMGEADRGVDELIIERTLRDTPQNVALAARMAREYRVPYGVALDHVKQFTHDEDKRVMQELFTIASKQARLYQARPDLFGAARNDIPLLMGLERSFDDFRIGAAGGLAAAIRRAPAIADLAPDMTGRFLQLFDDIAQSDPKERDWWKKVNTSVVSALEMPGAYTLLFNQVAGTDAQGFKGTAVGEFWNDVRNQLVAVPPGSLGYSLSGAGGLMHVIEREIARAMAVAQGEEFDASTYEGSPISRILTTAGRGGQEIAQGISDPYGRHNPQMVQDLTGAIGELGWQAGLGVWMMAALQRAGHKAPQAAFGAAIFNAYYNYTQSSFMATEMAREFLPEGADPIRADAVGMVAGLVSAAIRPEVVIGRIISPVVAPSIVPHILRTMRPDLSISAAVKQRVLDTGAAFLTEYLHGALIGLQTDLAMRSFVDASAPFRVLEVQKEATLEGTASAILRELVGFKRRTGMMQAASMEAARVQAMFKAVEGMDIAQNDPVSLRDIVNFVAEGKEGESPKELYINSRVLAEVLEKAGVPRDLIMREMPSIRDQVDLLPIGGTLAVNTAELLAFGARHGISNQLAQHTQISPQFPSYTELKAEMGQQEQAMAEIAQRLRTTVADASQWDSELAQIQAEVRAQIEARDGANWLTPEVAEVYTRTVSSFYDAMAAVMRVSPAQVQQIMSPTITNLTANAQSWAGALTPRVFGELSGRVHAALRATTPDTVKSPFDTLTPGEAMQTMMSLAPAAAVAIEHRPGLEARVQQAAGRVGALLRSHGMVPLQRIVTEQMAEAPDGGVSAARVKAWARSTVVAQSSEVAATVAQELAVELGGTIEGRVGRPGAIVRVAMDPEGTTLAEIEVVTPSVFLADEGAGQALVERLEHLPEGEARDQVQMLQDELYGQAAAIDAAPASVDSIWNYLQAMRPPGSSNPVITPSADAVRRADGDFGANVVPIQPEAPQLDQGALLQQGPALTDARDLAPAYVRDYMSPDEIADLTNNLAAGIVRALENIVTPREFAAVAFAGRAKRGWYRDTANALHAVFGADAPRFAAVLAALSPQTSVESNLHNALEFWVNWTEAVPPRPTDPNTIAQILAQSVERPAKGDDTLLGLRTKVRRALNIDTEGMGREELENLSDQVPDADWIMLSVMDSWLNNVVRAVTKDSVGVLRTLSGPKVDSFHLNALGDILQGTVDTFMAQFAGILQNDVAGRKIKAAVDEIGQIGIKSASYIAVNVRMRQAAEILTELTGEQWTTPEVQETIWSWVKTLQDLSRNEQKRQSGRTAIDIYKAGVLTHALIKGTADFASLFSNPRYAAILQRGGYGAKIQQLAAGVGVPDAAAGIELAGLEAQEAALDPGVVQSFRAFELKTARRLASFDAASDNAAKVQWAGDVAKHAGRHVLNFDSRPVQLATVKDFGPRNIKNILERDGWAILTAENPPGEALDAETTAQRQAALRAELEAAGHTVIDTEGRYDGPLEHPFIVVGITEDAALELGRKYGQDSVLTRRGLVYQDGTFSPAEGIEVMKTAPPDFYTRIPGTNTIFAIQLDFGRYVRPEHAEHRTDNMYFFSWSQGSGEATGAPTRFAPTPEDIAARNKPRTSSTSQTNIAKHRKDVVDGKVMTGTGLETKEFFGAVTEGTDARWIPHTKPGRAFALGKRADAFRKEKDKITWNFAHHIAASIPGFGDVQNVTGAAVLAAYGDTGATVLDIGASEAEWVRTLGKLSEGRIESVALDPDHKMHKTFMDRGGAIGVTYEVAAFGSKKDAGKQAWPADGDDPAMNFYDPKGRLADVVHESMTFQFIDNKRNAQVSRVKELMKPEGVFLTEQKTGNYADLYDAAEAKKDAEWKSLHFTPEQIETKKREVLIRGGDDIEGMSDKQVTKWEYERVLAKNFRYVVQYWSAGNFVGYAASDSRRSLQRLMNNMQGTDTTFAVEHTPRIVAQPQTVFYQAAGARAIGADLMQRDVAVRMESEGKGAREIRRQTGWERGLDGKWRFEISDADMTWAGARTVGGTAQGVYVALRDRNYEPLYHMARPLDTVIRHPALFAAYPQLTEQYNVVVAETPYSGDMRDIIKEGVKLDPYTDSDGQYHKGLLAVAGTENTGNAMSVLVHELQHAVQSLEGFAPGTNTHDVGIRMLGFDSREEYLGELGKRHDKVIALETKRNEIVVQFDDYIYKRSREWHRRHAFDESYERAQAYVVAHKKIYANAVKKFGADPDALLGQIHAAEAEAAKIRFLPKGAFEMYRRWGGEAEARNMQKRWEMATRSKIDLTEWPFADTYDMPLENIIVEWNGKPIAGGPAVANASTDGSLTGFSTPPADQPTQGIHYSNRPRQALDGRYNGTGHRGAEGQRLRYATDERIQSRVYLYLDEGHGVHPEPGVGAIAHTVDLTRYRLYNPNLDTERLWGHWDPNDNESAVLNAGYDGYWVPGVFGNQGAAVLLGEAAHSVPAQPVTPANDPMLRAGARGAFNPTNLSITLMENADFSTFMHETGHMFLHMLTEFAGTPDAPPSLRQDVQTLMEWMGVPDLPTWRNMTLDEQRPYHEQFAENWEVWLFEGRAPDANLRPLFRMYKKHMSEVYGTLDLKTKAAGTRLTDEVREVMGRMLSAEAQVRERASDMGMVPLFESADDAGMTQEQWLRYQAEHDDVIESAVERQTQRALRNIKWLDNARGRYVAKLQKQAAAQRREVHSEVEEEMAQEPLWAVQTWLRTGRLPDGTQTEGTRLSTLALREMYGEAPNALWRYLPAGLTGDGGTAEGFMHPDVVAEMFGFESGDAMVRQLIESGKRDVELTSRVDHLMLERFGDLATEEGMLEAASLAVHSDARARFIASELKSLEEAMQVRAPGRTATGKPRSVNVMTQAAREYARVQIERTKVSALHPRQFEAASRRAAKQAEDALRKGDLVAAARAKREQLVEHYMAKEALDAREFVDKARDYMAKFDKEGSRKRIPADYLEQIDAILEKLDLRKSTTRRQMQRRQSLKAWYDAQMEQDSEPLIDPGLLEDANLISYKQLTVEAMHDVVDGIKNIEHLGRLKDRLLTTQDKRRFNEVVEGLVENIRTKRRKVHEIPVDRNHWVDQTMLRFHEFGALHRKLSSLARQLDGGEDGGPLWEVLVRPLNAAMDNESLMRAEATRELTRILKPALNVPGRLSRKVHIPEIGQSLTREARVAIVLNMGNETNLQRLMGGDGWSMPQLQAIAATLTAAELRMVGELWSHLDTTYWGQIAAKEKRVTGVAPKKVEGQPVELVSSEGETVTLKGNYYPIKYDTYRSQRSAALEADTIAQQMRGGLFTRSTTRRGHVKARLDQVNRPVRKDLGVLMEHIEQVIHDLVLHEYLIDANRILGDKRMEQVIKETIRPEGYQAMLNTIRDVAVGVVPAVNAWETFLNRIRGGVSIASMGWNLMTAFVQPLGLTQSMARIGPKWVMLGAAHWVGDAVAMENTLAQIQEKSKFMRDRGRTMQREVAEIRNRVTGKKGDVRTFLESTYFWVLLRVQYVADIPTWQGAYMKSLSNGRDEATSVALADQAVRDAQGSGMLADMAGIQRGSPMLKLWTNFYNFFNTTYNLLAESKAKTSIKDPWSMAQMAGDVFMLITLPAMLSSILYTIASEEEPELEDIMERLIADQISYLMGTVVGVRDLSGIVTGFNYSGPAGLRFYSAVEKMGRELMREDINPERLAASSITVGGILFHFPATQVNRIWRGALAVSEDDAPLKALMFGPPRN